MLHACMLALRGIPVLYSGDEVGMLNDYTYHDDPARWADSRNIHRGSFDWEKSDQRHDMSTPAGKIFSAIQQLILIRKYNDIFHSDAKLDPVDTGDDRVLGFVRSYSGKRMLGLFNFSPDHVTVRIGNAEWTDMTDPVRRYERGSGKTIDYIIESYGFRWLMEK